MALMLMQSNFISGKYFNMCYSSISVFPISPCLFSIADNDYQLFSSESSSTMNEDMYDGGKYR